jgi:hypothetical protein
MVKRVGDKTQLSLEAGVDKDMDASADTNLGTVVYTRFLLSLRPLYSFKLYFGQ